MRLNGPTARGRAEAMRVVLAGAGARWTTLGQSYGGFLTMHYLSVAPASLAGCLVTGGMCAVLRTADEVRPRPPPPPPSNLSLKVTGSAQNLGQL